MSGEQGSAGNWNWVLVAVAFAGLIGLAITWIRLTRYRLARHEFEVLLGGIVIRRVFLHQIDQVFVGSRIPCEFWPSRWVFHGKRLTIRRKRGLIRNLTVTPPDPEQLRVNLYYALGWKPD